ncbi:hypothetical protein [Nitrosopumilus ureiphilus]|uniref:PLD phosphodiesterase domain-containing protein n=1 Tax=Nitrosopumilus ureiphilus TaxID=1470067 RepID=A0A7D5R275_9ARCH|nr:hypothetical protein [Nitrosopumilus ureiphilus]QLH06020.1 hypothetical protein C5F50_02200 [Nitrosopumilus ureiphilus]
MSLDDFALEAFGINIPVMSGVWSELENISFNENDLSLSSTNWRSPMSGIMQDFDHSTKITLLELDGQQTTFTGSLLIISEESYLKLQKLYSFVIENTTSLPVRPVPRYFLFSGDVTSSGIIKANDLIESSDELVLKIFDNDGMIIDPLAVASAFNLIINAHEILNKNERNDLQEMVNGLLDSSLVRVAITHPDGSPYDRDDLTNVTPHNASGLFTLDDPNIPISFDSSNLQTLMGPSTNGVLSEEFNIPAVIVSMLLSDICDFFRLRVVRLDTYLPGTPNVDFRGSQLEYRPKIRTDENISFLNNGNEILASLFETDSADITLCTSPMISTTFDVPGNANIRWPNFPISSGIIENEIPSQIQQINANFVLNNSEEQGDVHLTIDGLSKNSWVCIFPRKIIDNSVVRGDGFGSLVNAAGQLSVYLIDPLDIRKTNQTSIVNNSPKLLFDLVIVTRDNKSRIFGNLSCIIQNSNEEFMTTTDNKFAEIDFKGESKANILGLGTDPTPPPDTGELLNNVMVFDDVTESPRLPTMTRRDLLMAERISEHWKATIAGGLLAGEMINADQRFGSPGRPSGKETQAVGVFTENGLLAYDVARMALKRTNSDINERLLVLSDSVWREPAFGTGQFACSLLRNISPLCETPTFGTFREYLESNDLPDNLNDLVSLIHPNLTLPSYDDETRDRIYSEIHDEVITSCFGRRDTQWALEHAISNARNFIYIESPSLASTMYGDPASFSVDLFNILKERLDEMPGLHVIFCIPKLPDYPQSYAPMINFEIKDRTMKMNSLNHQEQVVAFHPIGFPGKFSSLETTTIIVDDLWMLVGSSTFRRRGLTFDGSSDIVLTDTQIENGRSSSICSFRKKLLSSRLGIDDSSSNLVRLHDGVESFYVIREMLVAGGLGKIKRFWKSEPDSATNDYLLNPDGQLISPDRILEFLPQF